MLADYPGWLTGATTAKSRLLAIRCLGAGEDGDNLLSRSIRRGATGHDGGRKITHGAVCGGSARPGPQALQGQGLDLADSTIDAPLLEVLHVEPRSMFVDRAHQVFDAMTRHRHRFHHGWPPSPGVPTLGERDHMPPPGPPTTTPLGAHGWPSNE